MKKKKICRGFTHMIAMLGPVLLREMAHGRAASIKAAEKSRKVCAGFRPCRSAQLKAMGKVPKQIVART